MNHKMRFKTVAVAITALLMTTSCHHATVDDRAEKEAREYTERYCPTPENDMQSMDSIHFDRDTHTFTYHYKLLGAADDPKVIDKIQAKVRTALLEDLVSNTGTKLYKDHNFVFHYIFRSKSTRKILFEERFTAKDYNKKKRTR